MNKSVALHCGHISILLYVTLTLLFQFTPKPHVKIKQAMI